MVGDGAYLPITHVGAANITSGSCTIPLKAVLVCPDIKKSWLSVSKLCEDYPCGVYFDVHNVYVIDLQTQKVVSKGPRTKGLYMLKSDEFAAFYSNRHVAVSESVWHHRLGHSNLRVLQHLQANKEIKVNKSRTSPICEPCQMGKSSRLQFSCSSSSVSQPLDCIHSDLWGPSPVASNQGFRYYVIFVDEHTRYTWFFPLHNKT